MKQSQPKASQKYPVVFDNAITPPHYPTGSKSTPTPVTDKQTTKQPDVRRMDVPHWLIS